MSLLLNIVAGLVVVICLAVAAVAIDRWANRGLLPGAMSSTLRSAYGFLDGLWYFYYATTDPGPGDLPVWIQGIQHIRVRSRARVAGRTELTGHPQRWTYAVRGEIRSGTMILVDSCEQNSSEYAAVVFKELRSEALVGIWTGFDNEGDVTSAPCVMSRTQRSHEDLTELVRASRLRLFSDPACENRLLTPGPLGSVAGESDEFPPKQEQVDDADVDSHE